ncbi:MAG: T9SS type A sorting domain-containing protein [Bacteroidota bacterium]
MKKLYTLIIALIAFNFLNSQSGVTNFDFENTASYIGGCAAGTIMPVGFGGQVCKTNGPPLSIPLYTLPVVAQSGTAYVTVNSTVQTCGMIDLGTSPNKTNPASPGMGLPYTLKPTSFCAYYRTSNMIANDSAFIIVHLSKNGINIGSGKYIINANQSVWTNVCAPITYTGNLTPDTLKVRFTPIKLFSGLTNINFTSGSNMFLDIDNFTLLTSTDLNSEINADNITILPNPANQFVMIRVNSSNAYSYSISNTLGKVIINSSGVGDIKINLNEFNAGIYFVTVKLDNQNLCKKLIVE